MKSLGGHYYTESELRTRGFAKVGKNVRIHSRASIYGLENISIGDNVRIDDFVVVVATNKMSIGDFVTIHQACFFGAKYGITIGNFVTFAPGVKVFTGSNDYLGGGLTGVTVPAHMTNPERGEIVFEDYCIIGAGSIILPGCKIGEGTSVGALSLIKKNLEPWGIYAGIPVKRLKERKKDLLKFADMLHTPD